MTKIRREAFADEQAYIAHQQNLAKLELDERMRQLREKQPKPKHPPAIARILWLMKRRKQDRSYYYADIERSRDKARIKRRRLFQANPELYRAQWRRSDQRRREENRLRSALYRQEHREELAVKRRIYNQAHKEEKRLYYAAHHEELKAKRRERYARKLADPVWREQNKAKRREGYAQKKAEKQQRDEGSNC